MAFYCPSYELLLAKYHVYAIRLIHSYFARTRQKTKVNMSQSSWEEIVFSGPLVFNIFLCGSFFIVKETDFWSYEDNSLSYRTVDPIDEVMKLLKCDSLTLFKWFCDNQMKASIRKCYLLVNQKDEVVTNLGETEIKNSEYEKLLGIKFDAKSNFNEHL